MLNILKCFKRKRPVYTFPEYEDTNPAIPPLCPPPRVISVGEYETEFSKQRGEAWVEYMEKRERRKQSRVIKTTGDINMNEREQFLNKLRNKEYKTHKEFYEAFRDALKDFELHDPEYPKFLTEVNKTIKETGQE